MPKRSALERFLSASALTPAATSAAGAGAASAAAWRRRLGARIGVSVAFHFP
jgi:hypothetical protein